MLAHVLLPPLLLWSHKSYECPSGFPRSPSHLPLRFLNSTLLQQCSKHNPELHLAECGNLAPAGTGTTSLWTALRNATGQHHFNGIHVNRIRDSAKKCYIMTLRDPATRLESGFRYIDSWNSNGAWSSMGARPKHKPASGLFGKLFDKVRGKLAPRALSSTFARNAGEFVAAIRANADSSNEALKYLSSFESKMDKGLLADRLNLLKGGGQRGAVAGGAANLGAFVGPTGQAALFLVSQLDYLRGLSCANMEVQFVCTEDFDNNWRELLNTFRMPVGSKTHQNWRSKQRGDSMSEADREFVRHCLYPWDYQLHELVCGAKQAKRQTSG
jgi:hypothetical protein